MSLINAIIWIGIIFIIEIVLFFFCNLLIKEFFIFIILHALLIGFSVNLIQSFFIKKTHNSNLKCLLMSFMVFLISISIFLPIGVTGEFLKIKIYEYPPMGSIFLQGYLYSLKYSSFILFIAIIVISLFYKMRAKKKKVVSKET